MADFRLPAFASDGRVLTRFGYYASGMTEALLASFATTASDKMIALILGARDAFRTQSANTPSIFY